MAKKQKTRAEVISQRELATGIFDLRLHSDLAREAGCGQFVALYPKDKSTLLPRPISLCEVDRQEGTLRLLYRVAGSGTAEFATLRPGESLELLGVLGNGFPVGEAKPGGRAMLIGGGIGIPPLLQLAKELSCETQVLLGYRDNQCFLKEEMEAFGQVYVATEDGSLGTKGNVMDIISSKGLKADIIYACGPLPMLRAVKAWAREFRIPAWLSLEERMACGVGACLGCVCKTKEVDAHSHVKNARICTDGPVFEAEEVDI